LLFLFQQIALPPLAQTLVKGFVAQGIAALTRYALGIRLLKLAEQNGLGRS
jgi:hypothetical protein